MGFKFFLKVSFHIKSSPGKDLRLIMIDSRQQLHCEVQILAPMIFLYFHVVLSPVLFPLFLQHYYLSCFYLSSPHHIYFILLPFLHLLPTSRELKIASDPYPTRQPNTQLPSGN